MCSRIRAAVLKRCRRPGVRRDPGAWSTWSGVYTVAITVAPPRRATATAARPTAPSAPVTTTRWSSQDEARNSPVAGDARNAEPGRLVVRHPEATARRGGPGPLCTRPRSQQTVRLGQVDPHAFTDPGPVDARPDGVDRAGAPSPCGMARGRHGRPTNPAVCDVADVDSETDTRTRTSPVPGCGSGLADPQHLMCWALPVVPCRAHAGISLHGRRLPSSELITSAITPKNTSMPGRLAPRRRDSAKSSWVFRRRCPATPRRSGGSAARRGSRRSRSRSRAAWPVGSVLKEC